MRTVTTLPSATEIVAALGETPVGVSHECDFPPQVADRPAVTTSRIDADASSAEIDRQVLEVSASGEGVYGVDIETLEALDPELIVTQGVCDVCAVDEAVIEAAVSEIEADPEILSTDPNTFGGVLGDIERIGRALGRDQRATQVVDDLEARVRAVRDRTAGRERPRVAIFDWTDPVMTAGHWTAELVDAAGGEYGLAAPGDRSTPREWETIRAYDPEVLIAAPCGFGLEQTAKNLADITGQPGFESLTAVREGQVWALDGHHYLNRPGPRLVDTLEYLAAIIHPARFGEPSAAVARPFSKLDSRLEQ